jgi:hypothetical protein
MFPRNAPKMKKVPTKTKSVENIQCCQGAEISAENTKNIQCCQGAEISAENTKNIQCCQGAEISAENTKKILWGREKQGQNFRHIYHHFAKQIFEKKYHPI